MAITLTRSERRYGVAVLAVAIALLLKLLLTPLIQEESPFLLFFTAITVSAWYGGIKPGLLATFLSALASDYFFLEPSYSFLIGGFGKFVRLCLFVSEGLSISLLSSALKTAQQKSEKSLMALQESEERFRLLVEGVQDYAIFALEDQGYIVSWNAGAERIKGYRPSEIIGQHFSRFYPQADVDQGKPARGLEIAVAEGRFEEEGWRIRKDGSRFWANVLITALRDRAGNLYGFAKVTRDITERKQAEEALQRSAERLAALHTIDRAILAAHSAPELTHAALGRMRQLIPYQQAYVVLFNFEQSEVEIIAATINRDLAPETGDIVPIEDFVTTQLQQEPTRYVKDIAALANRSVILERRLAQGMRSYIAVSLFVEENLLGELNLFASQPAAFNSESIDIASEVADQLAIAIQQTRLQKQLQDYTTQLEQRVAARTKDLEEANSELEAFTYSVSHDLRAPLRAMQGFAQALLEDYGDQLDAVGQDYAHRIVAAASRMDELINELLLYSRLSRSEIYLQTINLKTVVTEALAQLEAEIQQRQAQIIVEEPLPTVMSHRSTLVQILVNLLSNGIKFVNSGTQPQVRVWTEEFSRAEEAGQELTSHTSLPTPHPSNQWVRLWLEDNGIGIAPEHQQRIFQIFERLHGVETYPGTGIGLAIARKGIERIGGRLGLESKVGQGSRFWIELPKAADS